MGYGISEGYGILLVTELCQWTLKIHGLLQVMGCHKYGLRHSRLYNYLQAMFPQEESAFHTRNTFVHKLTIII